MREPTPIERQVQNFSQVPDEDARSYLLESWNDIETLQRECSTGKGNLPKAITAYEAISSMQSKALTPLLDTITFRLRIFRF